MKDASSNPGPPGAPAVPDHHLVRCIGKGSYGEVWLARGVTGVLRAVKIVRREDFEDDRTFEREFEGIRKFEPVSRNHRGLVHVLHIGRNDKDGFYYYVMELGDDVLSDQPVNEVEYEPRTLRSDVQRNGRVSVDDCLVMGEVLADALRYLHGEGLIHRDIKPSNVIFVDGVPKLADIGLVAPSGQQTYVGTEGFTPPEGPGTAQADIYSFGMVLYEVSTGMDRMEFPALPDSLPDEERPKWIQLNEVVCHACEPDLRDRYASAAEMHRDLEALGEGRKPKGRRRYKKWAVAAAAAGVVLAGALGATLLNSKNPPAAIAAEVPDLPPTMPTRVGEVKVVTQPSGARVLYENRVIGTTPHVEGNLPPGPVRFLIEQEGFRTATVEADVEAGKMAVVAEELEFYAPPVKEKPWTNQLGMEFHYTEDGHEGTQPVTWTNFEAFLAETGKASQAVRAEVSVEGNITPLALVPTGEAGAFCSWLLDRGRRMGFLGPEHYYEPQAWEPDGRDAPMAKRPDGTTLLAFICVVKTVDYGKLTLNSTPSGAEIYEMPGERYLGVAPLVIEQVLPGDLTYLFRLEGHEDLEHPVKVNRNEHKQVVVSLRPSRTVVFGKTWRNSLDMKLVPLGGLMISAWETRVSDWRAFMDNAENPDELIPSADFAQRVDEPVAGVSRLDAEAFCRWLTREERARGFIAEDHVYRLPTDAEWSIAVGLDEPEDAKPYELDLANKRDFPWGRKWPPPAGAGNFADESAPEWLRRQGYLAGYQDGFEYTSPVGEFEPNAFGLHDMAGNVWEWVSDDYGGSLGNNASAWGVCRGASWADGEQSLLLSSMRNLLKPDFRLNGLYGFRVVLARKEAKDQRDQTDEAAQDEGETPLGGGNTTAGVTRRP